MTHKQTVQNALAVAKLSGEPRHPRTLIGLRVEIPVHYDAWMRGARFGEITSFRYGKDGYSDCLLVKMDHPQIRWRLKLWAIDWDYANLLGD